MKKFFISYSHNDYEEKDKLLNELTSLENAGVIDIWDDTSIVIGDEWDDTIKQNLNEADIIVLLISKSFLTSKYIHEVELKEAVQRHKKGRTKVFPVILEECEWKNVSYLKSLQVSPVKNGRLNPIRKWIPERDGYKTVADSISRAIKEKKKKGILGYFLPLLLILGITGYIFHDLGVLDQIFKTPAPPLVITSEAPLKITSENEHLIIDELILQDNAQILVDNKCSFISIISNKTSIGKNVSLKLIGINGRNGNPGQNNNQHGGKCDSGKKGYDAENGTNGTNAINASLTFKNIQKLGNFSINGNGGKGGNGGNGGRGSNGGSASCSKCSGKNGGDGGKGGNGGSGGDGAKIKIFYSFANDFQGTKEIEDYIIGTAIEGQGGNRGIGGSGGSGGPGRSRKDCSYAYSRSGGKSGSKGPDGTKGSSGKTGKINFDNISN